MPLLVQTFHDAAWHTATRLAVVAPAPATLAAVRGSRLAVRLLDAASGRILAQSLPARGAREQGPRCVVPDTTRRLVLDTGADIAAKEIDPYNQQPSRVIVKNPHITQRFAAW